jgi:predicted NBD/HSP70 family sugar kinase
VIGTGVGGALVHDGKIIHGPHQHGGEFGYMVMNDDYDILSEVGSTGGLCRQLAKIRNVPVDTYDGRKVFALKEQGEGKMVFKANNILDRLVMLFEDEIVVEQQGEQITFSGIRRGVAKVIYRLN